MLESGPMEEEEGGADESGEDGARRGSPGLFVFRW